MATKSAAPLTFEVLHGSWTADGDVYPAGVHEIADATPDLVRLASHAHAAGALNVTEGLDSSSVQSQEDAEAAYAQALGTHVVEQQPDGTRISYWTGPWQEGNCLDYLATRGELVRRHHDSDDTFTYDDASYTSVQAGIVATRKQLEAWRRLHSPQPPTPDADPEPVEESETA